MNTWNENVTARSKPAMGVMIVTVKAKVTATTKTTAKTKTNAGILRCAQNDDSLLLGYFFIQAIFLVRREWLEGVGERRR